MEAISYFGIGEDGGEYSFLSNFYWHRTDITVEHQYQAAKTDDPDWKRRILDAETPAVAKKLGRKAPIKDHWDDTRIAVMGRLLRQKFSPSSELARRLLDTGDTELIEGNWWGDKFWGVSKGEGQNWLGKLLMQVRSELRCGDQACEVDSPNGPY